MKKSDLYLAIYLISLIGLNIAIFDVSMGEPYTKVTLNELVWQLIAPSILIGTQLIMIFSIAFKVINFDTKLKIVSLFVMLLLFLLEAATIYSYLSELKL